MVILCGLVHALHWLCKWGLCPSAGQVFLMAPAGALRIPVKGNFDAVDQQLQILVIIALLVRENHWPESFSVFSSCHAWGSCKIRENKRLISACNLKYSSFSLDILCQVVLNFFSSKWYKMPHPLPLCCPLQDNGIMVISTWSTTLCWGNLAFLGHVGLICMR